MARNAAAGDVMGDRHFSTRDVHASPSSTVPSARSPSPPHRTRAHLTLLTRAFMGFLGGLFAGKSSTKSSTSTGAHASCVKSSSHATGSAHACGSSGSACPWKDCRCGPGCKCGANCRCGSVKR